MSAHTCLSCYGQWLLRIKALTVGSCKVQWVFKDAEGKLLPTGVAIVLAKQVVIKPNELFELQ